MVHGIFPGTIDGFVKIHFPSRSTKWNWDVLGMATHLNVFDLLLMQDGNLSHVLQIIEVNLCRIPKLELQLQLSLLHDLHSPPHHDGR